MSKTIFYNQDQGFDFCFEDDQNQKSLCEICGCEIKKKRGMRYFHFNCWRQHFEEKTREKAQVIVNAMQEKMMPIAKQMTDRLKDAIGGDQVVNIN